MNESSALTRRWQGRGHHRASALVEPRGVISFITRLARLRLRAVNGLAIIFFQPTKTQATGASPGLLFVIGALRFAQSADN